LHHVETILTDPEFLMAQKVNKKKEVEDHDGCDICIAADERKIIRKCFADADGISIP
jgi:hypothetical protein